MNTSLMSQAARRRGVVFLIVLAAIVAFMGGSMRFFHPYDWLQTFLTSNFNSKPYQGEVVIVALDARQDTTKAWTRLDLAEVLKRVSAAGPKQIVIDRQFFGPGAQGSEELEATIAALPLKPIAYVLPVPKSNPAPDEAPYTAEKTDAANFFSEGIISASDEHVIPAHSLWTTMPMVGPVYVPVTVETDMGPLASLPELLADLGPLEREDHYPIDHAYDPHSVPVVPVARVLADDFAPEELRAKRVLLSFEGNALRDAVQSPHGPFISRAALQAIAAQTLIDGPPIVLGWIPAFLVALLAAIGWTYLPSPAGRFVGLGTLAAIGFSPFVMEQMGIYQETSDAVFLLGFFAMGRAWMRYSDSLRIAQEAAESKSWFLAQASHDLRQPIHAIGMLTARLGQTEMSALQRDLVGKIDRSVIGASRMFKTLLDVASIENGSLKPKPERVSINEILAEVDELNFHAAQQGGVDLRFVPSEAVIIADRALTVTLVQNLVSNAIKYATGKKVLVGCRPRGSRLSIAVYDRGKGIEQSNLKRVSKAFYRIGEGPAVEGAGLGLAIVRQLCELMGLKFALRSEPGHGTAAVLSGFRRALHEPVQQMPDAPAGPRLLAGRKVLIIDDDRETLQSTAAMASQWGCDTETSRTFAADIAHAARFDVIVADFDLGEGRTLADHADLIATLKARKVPTIVVSGHPEQSVIEAMNGAAAFVLHKPVSPAELRSVLMAANLVQD